MKGETHMKGHWKTWRLSAVAVAALAALAIGAALAYANDPASVGVDVAGSLESSVTINAAPGDSIDQPVTLMVAYGNANGKHVSSGGTVTFSNSGSVLPSGGSAATGTVNIPSTGWGTATTSATGAADVSFTAPSTDGTYNYTAAWSPSASSCTGSGSCLSAGALSVAITVVVTTPTPPDTTPPTFNCDTPDGQWHASDVTLNCTAIDSGSGLANQSDASFTLSTNVLAGTETNNASTDSHQVCDIAGNCVTAGPIDGNMVDEKSPTITDNGATTSPTGNDGALEWYDHDVTNSFSAEDGGSGLASCLATWPVTTTGEGKGITVASGPCADNVGNSNAGINSGSFNIDETAPVVTSESTADSCAVPGDNGWCTGTQTAGFTASDALSGLADSSQTLFTQSTAENGSSVYISSGPVRDNAGNTNAGVNAGPYKIDSVPPTSVVTGVTGGAKYTLGAVPTAGCTASDDTSGVASDGTPTITGLTNGVGTATVSCNGATDKAGNTQTVASESVTYNVVYAFSGFLSPLSADPTVVNVGNAGRTYPIKYQLTDANGNYITNAVSGTTITAAKVSCTNVSGDPTDSIDYVSSTGGTALRYDSTANQYIYNWATPSTKNSCYRLTVMTPDGQADIALFQLK
jgi:hypothetical protein